MSFGMFVLLFTLLKLMRMMAAATVVLAAALILCRLGGARTWRLNLGMLALVPFACLMGYSKIFSLDGCLFLRIMSGGLSQRNWRRFILW